MVLNVKTYQGGQRSEACTGGKLAVPGKLFDARLLSLLEEAFG
jgi:hypothetical protein